MNLDFLEVSASEAVARSPMEGMARAAGARFAQRDGWNVAISYTGGPSTGDVAWADVSHLAKIELQGTREAIDTAAGAPLQFGTALRQDGAWWCRLTASRALVIGARPTVNGVQVTDVTSNFAALTLVGALTRETFARFCALDLRPHVTPINALRPGSIGRQPGILIREAQERYLFLFGWATAEYMWSVVADAANHLGGGPLGLDALGPIDA